MKNLFLLFAAVVFVSCNADDPDPTKICIPNKIQWNEYNFDGMVTTTTAIDFDRKLEGRIGDSWRIVLDFNTMTRYEIDASGMCKSYHASPEEFPPNKNCLPESELLLFYQGHEKLAGGLERPSRIIVADAVYHGNISIGVGPMALKATAWEIPLSSGTAVLAILDQPNQPRYPVIYRRYGTTADASIIFNDPSTNITVPSPFDYPKPCPPGTTV